VTLRRHKGCAPPSLPGPDEEQRILASCNMDQERCASAAAPPPVASSERGAGAEGVGSSAALLPHFTAAANAVTRLYRAAGTSTSPDRARFAIAANSVTSLYRAGEAESLRSYHRGSVPAAFHCFA
jgi:hypothetical protein